MAKLRILIVSGLSGSGKSTAIKALEDLGFFCADNLPVVLLPKFVELCLQTAGRITKIALVIDLREREFLHEFPEIFKRLRQEGQEIDVLFLEASDAALVRRFQETRRPHPLGITESVLEGIKLEREQLKELRSLAAWVIDTSELTGHQLKKVIRDRFGQRVHKEGMRVAFLSFGFRHGIPQDADLVMDVRFLPNPYFVPALKPFSGGDPAVADYVLRGKEAKAFMDRFEELLDFLLPLYQQEGKAYITIALGCTGGRHRSVTVAAELGRAFEKKGYQVKIHHRDMDKEEGDSDKDWP